MANESAGLISRGGPTRKLWDTVLGIRLGRLLRWLAFAAFLVGILGVAAFVVFVLYPVRSIPSFEHVDEYVYLDQGWGTKADTPDRQTYYYTPQGTSMPQGELVSPLRYSWFVNLEMPLDQRRFAAPGHMQRYRFIVDPQPTASNPDRLPVGFTRHFDSAIGEYVLDITCAACHTGEIHAHKDGKTYAIRIDGGQAMHEFTSMQRGAFGPTLVASMLATWADPWKFDRFAHKVIGARYPQGKSALHSELGATLKAFVTQGQNNPLRHLYPIQEGFGRTDALGRIANTVFGDHLTSDNYRPAEAPASYPYVWNIWKFDWVQYNASVAQPLARNIGEALGVGAVIRLLDAYGNPLPPEQRFASSVIMPNLDRIEHTLQKLKPPRWPEDLLGPIDRPLAARGKVLFESHCQGCHGPHPADAARQAASAPGKTLPGTEWMIDVIPVEHIGTDPGEADGFLARHYDLSRAGLTREELARLLRPLLVRDLARDARWRLQETIAARQAAGQDSTSLAAVLAAYPDPNADPTPSIPRASFAAIGTDLGGAAALDGSTTASSPIHDCDLNCQTQALLHDVVRGETDIDAQLSKIDVSHLTEGEGLNVLGLLIKAKYFADNKIGYRRRQCLDGFGALDLPQQVAGYKPRPLEGVWATPPFLHNGSVPNLYEMLLPPEQRSKRFFVGRRDFDAKRVGYVTVPADPDQADGFWLDTRLPGNHNTGHAFTATPAQMDAWRADPKAHPLPTGVIGPLLSDAERWALVEYLKIHRDLPATPADFTPPDCSQ
ncbi:MAG TPA: di-heme-cytochrome C peroxidase [Rudaea sp.]|nr:di-heme-cytochrome C peroxidase [Rudaea sp.]